MNILAKFMVFQVFLGLIGISHVFGGPPHISGVVHENPQSSFAHISGRAYSVGNSPTVQTHVSGANKLFSTQKPGPVKSKLLRKARNIGITLGDPGKLTSTHARKKNTEKTKTRTTATVEEAGLRGRIKKRKACWKTCGNTWKDNFQRRCFALSGLLKERCKKEIFKERLICVSQNCR